MKRSSPVFLRIVTALVGVAALGLLFWEAAIEGRNAHGAATAKRLLLLAGTPLQNETDSYPVTLYALGPRESLETVRQIFSKSQGLFDVRDDLQGRLYVMNEWQSKLNIIDESNPERVDTVGGDFGAMYLPPWGVAVPPGRSSVALYAVSSNPGWKVFAVSGSASTDPRIYDVNWSLYQWFRYRGAPVTPRPECIAIPTGNIAGDSIVLGPVRHLEGKVSDTPPDLPASVGAHTFTIEDASGAHTVTVRSVGVVAETSRFFAFAALPSFSQKWPVPVYVLDRSTGSWKVIDSPFVRLWPRLFGSWLATTDEGPNPSGQDSPGLENERSLPPGAYRTSDLPQVRGMYGTKGFMPGKLLLQSLVDGREIAIQTGQQDSEVLDVRSDGLVLYRVNDEIFSAQIEGDKLSAPTLVVKGDDVPEIHWAFWSNAQTNPPGSGTGFLLGKTVKLPR